MNEQNQGALFRSAATEADRPGGALPAQKRWCRILRIVVASALVLATTGVLAVMAFLYYEPAPSVLVASGSAEAMGTAQGKELRTRIRLLTEIYLHRVVCRGDKRVVREREARALEALKHWPEAYQGELRAVAKAAKVDPGSIAYGSWSANQVPGNPNNVPVGYSQTSPGSRVFAALSYRLDYFNFGATTVSVFFDNYTFGNGSYTYSGDMNGDAVSNNDLIYVPRNTSEMNFVQFTSGGHTYTPAEQAAAWDAYISQDKYLDSRRGQYAERNGAFLPMVSRMDLSIIQSVYTELFEKKHTLEIRLDILNFSNLLSNTWGQGQHFVNLQPLIVPTTAEGGPANAAGAAQFKMRVVNNRLMDHTFESNTALSDVYAFQLGLKYYF